MTLRFAGYVLLALVCSGVVRGAEEATLVYVGTASDASPGIHLFRLQPQGTEVTQNVTLVPLGLAAETRNASFFELDLKRRLLFAVNEIDSFEGKATGAVSAFAIEAGTGKLKLLSQRSTLGRGPTHLTLAGRTLLVANAGSGGVSVLRVENDGRLGEAIAVTPPVSAGCVAVDPAQRFAFVCDLGADRIVAYGFETETGKLTALPGAGTPVTKGSGPHRLVFRPDGRFAYVLGARASTLTALVYDAPTGRLEALQTVSTLPEYFEGENTAGEVAVHPSGKYLYVSNRGHNSVVLFRIDEAAGTLTYVEEQGTGGKSPRHFGFEPSGKHLAIANQDSDTVLASRVDAGNGRLKPSGIFASVPQPACVRFLPPAEPAS